jgi:hypothetical protein
MYLATRALFPGEVDDLLGRVILYAYAPAVFALLRLLGVGEGDGWAALGLIVLLMPIAGALLAALYSLLIAAVAVAIARLRAR